VDLECDEESSDSTPGKARISTRLGRRENIHRTR
jgi:hypothetical protein